MSEFRDVGVCSIATLGNASNDAFFVRATAVGTLDELLPENVFFDYLCDQSNEQHLEPNGSNGLRLKATAFGDGIGGGGTAKVSVDIAGLIETTTLAPTDELMVRTASGLRRVDVSVLSVSAQDKILDTLADLRALGASERYDRIFVKGHSADYDGGEGTFVYLGTGATTGDVDSSGDDDDGWHVVVTSSGDIYGRDDGTIRPQHFGVIPYATHATAGAGSDQYPKLQRSLTLWTNPNTFSNAWAYRGGNAPTSLKWEASSGFYRVETTCDVKVENVYQSGIGTVNNYVPGDMRWYGSAFVPYAIEMPGIQVRANRDAGKPRLYVKASKERAGNSNCWFVSQNWPPIARNTSRYRSWTASTSYSRHERIIHQHANGSVYLYVVETGEEGPWRGTTGVAAPTHTTGTVADGGVSLKCIGMTQESTANGSATFTDKLRRCRDWGIFIRASWELKDVHWEADGFTVGLACVPKYKSAVGWSTFHQHQCHACKIAMLVVDYGVEQHVASLVERDAIVSPPVDYRVYVKDTDTVYSWDGSVWAVYTITAGWCNDNTFHCGVVAPNPHSGVDNITSSDSIYGIVIDQWEKNAIGPNNNHFMGLAVENFENDPAVAETVQVLLAAGDDNHIWCRDDAVPTHGRMFVAWENDWNKGSNNPTRYQNTPSPWRERSPDRNIIHLDRAGVIYASTDRAYRTSWNNTRWNIVREHPGDVGESPVSVLDVPSIRKSGVFSGTTEFYSTKLCTWVYNQAAPLEYIRLSNNYSGTVDIGRYHAASDSFDAPFQYPLSFLVDLPDNFQGLARLLLNTIIADPTYNASGDGNIRHWIHCRLLDEHNVPIESSGSTVYPSEPCWPMVTSAQSSNFVRWQTATSSRKRNVYALVPAPHIRRMVISVAGPRILGVNAQLFGDQNARILPVHYDSRITDEVHIGAPPEKGVYRAPALYRERTDPARAYRLDVTDTSRRVYATAGRDTVVNPGSTSPNVWVHDGAAQGSAEIFEWDGSALQSIATSAYYTEPDDWSVIGGGVQSDGNLGANPVVNFTNGDRAGVLDVPIVTPTFIPPATPGTWVTWTVTQAGGGSRVDWVNVPLETGGLKPVIDTAAAAPSVIRLFWDGTVFKRETSWA